MYMFGIPSFVVFKSLLAVLFFHSTLSAPINSSLSYDIFLKNITRDNCAFPSGVVLPFKESSTTFEYFSEPLKICKAPEAMKRSLEAITLCNEIYDALRNITCHSEKNFQLPDIKIEFSDNVCKDINSLKLQHALEEKGLLQHLTDEFICNMICEDDFLPACKVLLWSYQLKKRIAGIPLVQSIQNSLDQDNANVGSGTSSISKTLKLNKEDVVNNNELLPLEPTKVPIAEIADAKNKMDPDLQIVNDDIDAKGIASQTLKSSTDKLTISKENKTPGEQTTAANKGDADKLDKKQDETPKVFEQKQPRQKENGDSNVKEEAVGIKQKEQTPIVDEKAFKENAIDENDGPPKLSKTSDSEKTVFKNNPAVLVPGAKNKTELKKEVINIQKNLTPVTQKESPVKVEPMDIKNNTSNDLKPAIPGLQNELNKIPETVSRPSTPSKTSPVETHEAELPKKPAVDLAKENEVTDTPTFSKEDVFSVTTQADFEKGGDGNEVPADKNPDLYNEEESAGDYNKFEDDEDALYDLSKNKKPDESESEKILKPSVTENESSKYVFSQRNSFGRGSEDIPVIPAFPEQEDSHFFFYFLSLVLILMAGYLLFHNKQKIIALIVEGRHERRRRSHGLGYKKLETK